MDWVVCSSKKPELEEAWCRLNHQFGITSVSWCNGEKKETDMWSRQKQCIDGALLFQDNFISCTTGFFAAVFVSFIPG